ncbi:MAG: hypothetical protein ONA69_01450, partial [candidate division KSB1 bacterium]|nr:hypothetical protein [candidate division KSB1 bacterium]
MKYRMTFGLLLFVMSTLKAQMVAGFDIPEFGATFGIDPHRQDFPVKVKLKSFSALGNVLWPLEQASLVVQLDNRTGEAVQVDGFVEIIAYGTKGRPGDIWTPQMFKISEAEKIPLQVRLDKNAFSDVPIELKIPETFGAYGIIADLGPYGRQFITSCIRTFSFPEERLQFPSFCLDDISPELLRRLGVHAIRMELNYKPTDDADFEEWYKSLRERFGRYETNQIAVLVKISAPEHYSRVHPLGIPRPHLDPSGIMLNTKCDMAWLPQFDDDFREFCYRIACEFGWPKGPINAFSLWNEPWEGLSISGWGADMLRYREIFTVMCEAVEKARHDAGVEILLGGGSSTSNALDKFFADGSDAFLDRFDFCSIHYQGLFSWATIKRWVNRRSSRGRVRIWDTESWVANTDDRIAAVVAANKAAGYDRAMGVYGGNICQVERSVIRTDGGDSIREIVHAWPPAAAVGAVQHFIGERRFRELLFRNGLPWIIIFDGITSPDDGTAVVVGDLGDVFGADALPFRTVRSIAELEHKSALWKHRTAPQPVRDAKGIAETNRRPSLPEPWHGACMILKNPKRWFSLYDFYGNLQSDDENITIFLDHRGFFLRSNGSAGSFAALLQALRNAKIIGLEPLEMIVYDFTTSIGCRPPLKLRLTNVLNRSIKGTLTVTLGYNQSFQRRLKLSFKPHQTRCVTVKHISIPTAEDNTYPLRLTFDAGRDGIAVHEEELHVNLISRRTIEIDGDLSDWHGALPQIIRPGEDSNASLTEAAWYPFKEFEAGTPIGAAVGWLACDDSMFYFAAKISDSTPDPGMIRFSCREDDQFFYPDTCYIPLREFTFGGAMKHSILSYSARWNDQITLPRGTCTLIVEYDGYIRLYLNGRLVLNHGGNFVRNTVKLSLEGDGHPIDFKLEYRREGGNQSAVRLQWKDAAGNCFQPYHDLHAEYFVGPDFNLLLTRQKEREIDHIWNDDVPHPAFNEKRVIPLVWPQGVRRFSYRQEPELPAGNSPDHDNVQIAFNVLEDEEKDLYPCPPGVMKGFTNYQCSDYEYALNPVAEQYGGGTEIWRLRKPGLPHKHFYPRQPSAPQEGAVTKGRLVIVRRGDTRIVEAALPWSELPHVKKRLDAGKTIK